MIFHSGMVGSDLGRLLKKHVNSGSFMESSNQSKYIEVAQGDIFMEQKMKFGLVLGWFWAGWQY